jgi:hypothetical protein
MSKKDLSARSRPLKYAAFEKDPTNIRWRTNLAGGSPITAKVSVRRLGRLFAYKTSDKSCSKKTQYYRFQKTGSKQRAEQRERAEINKFERQYDVLPECNKRREYPPRPWWE